MFLNNGDNSFTDITEASGLYYKHNTFMGLFVDVDNDGLEDLIVAHDTGFGISPITADFNGDGYPDLVHINIAGKPRAYINNGGDANYLKVQLPDTIASIAAKISVKRSDGKIIYRDFISGEGLCSDQSHIQTFGLEDTSATDITVQYINGETEKNRRLFERTR